MLDLNPLTTRAAAMEAPSLSTKYSHTHLPPLAIAETVPETEDFATRPQWVFLVARSALSILVNSIMIAVRNERDSPGFTQRVLEQIKAAAQLLGGDAARDLNNSITIELTKRGSPTDLPELKAFLEGVIERFARTLTIESLRGFGKALGQVQTISGPASSIEDYDQLFQFVPLPAVSRSFRDDAWFAAMRVAGPNPLMIERMKVPDERLPITDEQFQSVMGTHDTVKSALADGRLYLADYSVFDGALDGSFPSQQKYNYAPLALFAVPAGGRSLVPLAIQCAPKPGPDNPIILPRDGERWMTAKTVVQIADSNYHEAVSHLARTHLLVEPFVIATRNQLSITHPLFALLTPHFEGTLAINNAALRNLVSSGGLVDKLLSSSIDQARVLAAKGAQSYQRNINTSMLPLTLAQRGVDDVSRLPDYPYRDDALLLWGAIGRWVNNYVHHYYRSDAAVQGDAELQKWVAELVAHDGGRLDNIGAANRVNRRAELVDLVTLICFTASVQHAAVNYPQGSIMTYMPAMAQGGYSPLPVNQEDFGEDDFLKFLPPLETAKSQLDILHVLGSVYYTRLGDYGDDHFTDPVIRNHLAGFQRELIRIEEEINERNKTRTPYEFLLPSRIPQSINI